MPDRVEPGHSGGPPDVPKSTSWGAGALRGAPVARVFRLSAGVTGHERGRGKDGSTAERGLEHAATRHSVTQRLANDVAHRQETPWGCGGGSRSGGDGARQYGQSHSTGPALAANSVTRARGLAMGGSP